MFAVIVVVGSRGGGGGGTFYESLRWTERRGLGLVMAESQEGEKSEKKTQTEREIDIQESEI